MERGRDGKVRCFGNGPGKEFYARYHDEEWAVPLHDDRALFELLVLEGMQAGLSWEIILKKREGYQKAFYNFDASKVAAMSDRELEDLCRNPSIIRNRLKIRATRTNARVFLKIQQEFGSFDSYLWRFVDDRPIKNRWKSLAEVPSTSAIGDSLSRDLKKRGMTFVGPKIAYAFMQAVGMVNDHVKGCWRYEGESIG